MAQVTHLRNPVKEQSRVGEAAELFNKYGYTMFPQQRGIYERLWIEVRGKSLLEAGCGDGQGIAILCRSATRTVIATDKLEDNIDYARQIYKGLPIKFLVWDIEKDIETEGVFDAVVCVETLEHVKDPERAIANLIAVAKETVWISTPNGTGKPQPPENPYHVQEYTPKEMFWMLKGHSTTLHSWDTFEMLSLDTLVDPLVYRISL